jgi:hypothetical protein
MMKGNLVNWDTAKFELYNMTLQHYKIKYICKPISPGNLVFLAQRNFVDHNAVCYRLRGRPTKVRDIDTQVALSKESLQHLNCADNAGMYWSGWSDSEDEGNMTYAVTGEYIGPIDFQPWYPGEPDGESLQNCVGVSARTNTWADVSCSKKMCGFCDMESLPALTFRGMTCTDLRVSNIYFLANDQGSFLNIAVLMKRHSLLFDFLMHQPSRPV